MVKFLIKQPISVIMIFVAILLISLVSIFRIPISPLPNIDIPEISIKVSDENSSAKEIERNVVRKIRDQLGQISNLEDVFSESKAGNAILKLRFKYGTNLNYAFLEVNEKIDQSMVQLPDNIARPRVIKSSVSDLPVFYLNLTLNQHNGVNDLNSFVELGQFSEQVIKRRLEQLSEVAVVDISGVVHEKISVLPDLQSLRSLGLDLNDFKLIINKYNFNASNISGIESGLEYTIIFNTPKLNSVEDIENLSIEHKGRSYKLKDIAKIKLNLESSTGSYYSNGKRAISLAIIKQSDATMSELKKNVDVLINNFKQDYKYINFEQIRDESQILEYSISNLKQDLVFGSFLAFILLYIFLKDFRSALLVCITVPVSLLISIMLFNWIGITINIISLSGLVLGVGLMIDNSIIVIDNISQYQDRGYDLDSSCDLGTNQIIRPLISSVLTTCSVFLPLIYLSGISGALFYDQAMAISIGIAISLIVSITLLPTCYRILHLGFIGKKNIQKSNLKWFERLYEKGFNWMFRNKLVSLILVIILLVVNLLLFTILKKERLPLLQQNELIISINWNEDISISENSSRILYLTKLIENKLLQSSCTIGEQQYLLNKEKELSASQAELYLKFKETTSSHEISSLILEILNRKYHSYSIDIRAPKNIFEQVFSDDDFVLEARITGNTADQMPDKQSFDRFTNKINHELTDATFQQIEMQSSLSVAIDPQKIAAYNLSLANIYEKLRWQLGSNQISALQSGIRTIPIILEKSESSTENLLQSITVKNNEGIDIPIRDMVSLQRDSIYKSIEGGKTGNFIALKITANDPTKTIDDLNGIISKFPELQVDYTGSFLENKSIFLEMWLVMAVALFLLYIILAAQFESFIQPVIVLFELPISLSGAVIMLFFFDGTVNLISLIGFVVISGIVINDSILKLSSINELIQKEGYSLMDAIHTAGLRRLKSIIMTSLITILSVAPFIFGSDIGSILQRPLALTLLGGMSLGTIVSLYFIPLVYWFYYNKKTTIKVSN